MKSVMKHQFSEVPKAQIPRSSFDRSHGYKTTLDTGYLIPVFIDEALPGDTFSVDMAGFARLATPISPFMDNLYIDTHFFAVPHRLLWDNWKKFNGEQTDPGDSTDFIVPQVLKPAGGFLENSLEDYFGLPVGVENIRVAAFHHRAYNLIFNEWFRDQNLVQSQPIHRDDGPDPSSSYKIMRRGKRHDYFTSCLPWPQKGDAVDLPLGTTAPVTTTGQTPTWDSISAQGNFLMFPSSGTNTDWNQSTSTLEAPAFGSQTGLQADLTNATAATINELRQSFQIQKMLERDARGGSRYTEIVKSHFGVTSPDARLQRPEYLGGGSTPVYISPVAQTSETSGTTPQGNLAAIGTSTMRGHGFVKSFTEHCVIVGIASVRADLTYQQGLDRHWSRLTRYDFYWPALSHIGEQPVYSKEIYADGSANDEDVFGYQERYAEYRYKPSKITGKMRSTAAAPLDVWHLSQYFTQRPVLGQSFIEENPPVDRVIAVVSEPEFILDTYFTVRCARPMPMYGVPGLIDHF